RSTPAIWRWPRTQRRQCCAGAPNGSARATHPLLQAHRWIERIAARHFRLRENVSAHRGSHIVPAELALDRKTRHVERVKREDVAMDDRIVPRGTGSVVAEVIAGHILVAGKPAGVVVDAVPSSGRRLRTRLAARRNTVCMRAASDALQ